MFGETKDNLTLKTVYNVQCLEAIIDLYCLYSTAYFYVIKS